MRRSSEKASSPSAWMPAGWLGDDGRRLPKGGPSGVPPATERHAMDGEERGDGMSDLLEERDFLLRSLRDLEAERAAGDIEENDYRELKDDYTARAAAVIRALDEPAPPA